MNAGDYGWRLLLVACAAMQSAFATAADDPRFLSPVSDWQLKTSGETCWITRTFGNDNGDPISMTLHAFGPGDTYQIRLVGKGLPDRTAAWINMMLRFNPDTEAREAGGIVAPVSGSPALIFESSLETTEAYKARVAASEAGSPVEQAPFNYDVDRERAVDQLIVEGNGVEPITFELGSMAAPAALLHTCTDTLVRNWGFDLEEQQALSRHPVLRNIEKLGQSIRFPRGMYLAGASLFLHIRLNVDASGKATDCVLQSPKWDTKFEKDTCNVLRSTAKFDPALGRDGQPVASFYTTTVVFVIKART